MPRLSKASLQNIIAAALLAFAATTVQATGADSHLRSSAKVKASIWGIAGTAKGLVAVGTGGAVALSETGKTWDLATRVGKPLLLSAAPAGPDGVVIAGGTGFTKGQGVILRSTDGGKSFREVAQSRAPFYEVKLRNDLHGHAVGVDGVMVETKDGGLTWKPIDTGTQSNLWAVHFLSEAAGLIAGGNTPWQNDDRSSGEIRRTDDGGRSWTVVHSGDKRISDFSFVDATTGYAAGVGGTMLMTQDGGKTWSPLPKSPLKAIVNAIEFADPSCGIAVGAGGDAYVTTDGARTWSHRIMVTEGSFLEDLAPKSGQPGAFWTVAGDGTIGLIDIAKLCVR